MPKRFTDTDKWKKKFIRSLQGPYKLLWLYILDECDHAGVWIVDFEVASLRLDEVIDEKEALKLFGEKILPIEDGEKWLVLDFIDFQYGSLNEENRAHASVIKILKKYGLWHKEDGRIKKNKALTSPLQGAKDKDKEQDKDKVKDKDKDKDEAEIPKKFSFKNSMVEYGFNEDLVDDWILVRKNKKATNSETAFVGFISEIEKRSCNLNDVLKIIIEKSWAGFKWQWIDNLNSSVNGKQQTSKGQSGTTDRTARAAELYQKYGGKLGEQGSGGV
jgi:hypothetical protein